jgi:hypothetical protein
MDPFWDTKASNRVEQALTQLAQARRYAEDARVGLWDSAVEIGCLEKQGLTTTDLRWLVAKGICCTALINCRRSASVVRSRYRRR